MTNLIGLDQNGLAFYDPVTLKRVDLPGSDTPTTQEATAAAMAKRMAALKMQLKKVELARTMAVNGEALDEDELARMHLGAP